jgi:hypothetical protein
MMSRFKSNLSQVQFKIDPAARAQKVSYGDVLPQIAVVQNSYISIVAYQNKGYALLPMN